MGLFGRIYVGALDIAIYYISGGPHGFGKQDLCPIISLRDLYVANATRDPIQSAQKLYAAFLTTW